MRVLVLTRYGRNGASSRMRFFQFLPWLDAEGWSYEVSPFFTDQQLARRYSHGSYGAATLVKSYVRRIAEILHKSCFDIVWIEKEALCFFPASIERWLLSGVPYVLDYDDAVFHNYDRHRLSVVRRVFGRRLDDLMAGSRLVVAGNEYLARRARSASASWVEKLPTVIELSRYRARSDAEAARPRVVWIGSPSTVRYLLGLRAALAALATRIPFTLRVIGGGSVDMPGVEVEAVDWSSENEAESIRECDVGVMPLEDTPWERGKCAYKLIQYMACGLPTVASPVGANVDVVLDGETGYFAQTDDEWIVRLETLLSDEALRRKLGSRGRELVEEKYCVKRVAPVLIDHLARAAGVTPAGAGSRDVR